MLHLIECINVGKLSLAIISLQDAFFLAQLITGQYA